VFKHLYEHPTDKLWLHLEEVYDCKNRECSNPILLFDKKKGWHRSKSTMKNDSLKGIENVEELGALIQKMTQEKVEHLRAQKEASEDISR